MKNIILLPVIVAIIIIGNSGCDKDEATINNCIMGKFVDTYCEGIVIQILDETDIGIDWYGMYDGKSYTKSVVASVDSLLAKTIATPEIYFSADSVFYFRYINGGYPRKQYNLCEPSSSITITYVSKDPCKKDVGE